MAKPANYLSSQADAALSCATALLRKLDEAQRRYPSLVQLQQARVSASEARLALTEVVTGLRSLKSECKVVRAERAAAVSKASGLE